MAEKEPLLNTQPESKAQLEVLPPESKLEPESNVQAELSNASAENDAKAENNTKAENSAPLESDTLPKHDTEPVQRTLGLINLSKTISSRANCVIEITNSSGIRKLSGFIMVVNKGHVRVPSDPTITCRSKCISAFTKIAFLPGESSGLLSYMYDEADHVQKRFVVFWQVRRIRANMVGIGWTKDGVETIKKDMFEQFAAKTLPEDKFQIGKASDGAVEITAPDNVTLKATMGDNIHAILKVEFSDKQKVSS